MDNIIKFAECYLLHKAIVINLDKNIPCVQDMVKEIDYYGSLSIENLIYKLYVNEFVIKMYDHYDAYFTYLYEKTLIEICDDVQERISGDCCMQHGFGYLVHSKTWKFPQYWCVKVEKYTEVQLKDHEWLALKICGIDLRIDTIAGQII